MDGKQSGWQGRTFVVRIDPAAIYPLNGGYGTRVSVAGDFTLDSLYVGPGSARDPFVAAALYRLTFNGGDKTVAPIVDDFGNFLPVVTDTLPLGLDATRGLIITGYIDPYGNGLVATQSVQFGWQSRYALGDSAIDVDKRAYVDVTQQFASVAVWMTESYYTPPWSGISLILP
jgi:hypothetical protein